MKYRFDLRLAGMVDIFSTGSLLAAGAGIKGNDMDVYEKEKVMLSVLSLTQKKIDEAYALGKKEAQAEIDEAWSAGHLSATTEDVELMDAMKEKHKSEIDELVEMLEEAMEWNWLVNDVSMGHAADVSRSKGQALIAKHKGE